MWTVEMGLYSSHPTVDTTAFKQTKGNTRNQSRRISWFLVSALSAVWWSNEDLTTMLHSSIPRYGLIRYTLARLRPTKSRRNYATCEPTLKLRGKNHKPGKEEHRSSSSSFLRCWIITIEILVVRGSAYKAKTTVLSQLRSVRPSYTKYVHFSNRNDLILRRVISCKVTWDRRSSDISWFYHGLCVTI